MRFTPPQLAARLEQFPAVRRYWVAYSGGCDSHVLLHALVALRSRLVGVTLCALHVNHELHPQASAWSAHCQAVCDALEVPLTQISVDARGVKGESPEAAARAARYRAFAGILEKDDGLLLAHHRDDQAETLLLQLLRGGGPRGLAGMPQWRKFAAGWLGRPLLAFSRQSLCDYARAEGLQWIDDPSNFDTEFDRNYLRQTILPMLRQRWPSVGATLARAAGHQAEAAALLTQVAERDWQRCRGESRDTLRITPFMRLLKAERQNLLRYWINDINGLQVPDSRRLTRIQTELIPAAADAQPSIRWPGGEVRRYAGQLYLLRAAPNASSGPLVWDLKQTLPLHNGQQLLMKRKTGQGLKASLSGAPNLTIRFRQGGERCRPAGRGHRHRLKKLMQEWQVPPWQRDSVPLLYVGEEIAAVVGYCVCEPYQAEADEEGVVLFTD